MQRELLIGLIVLLFLAACGGGQATAPSVEQPLPVEPTKAATQPSPSKPTPTLEPTPTPLPTNTALPEGTLFRDDFSGTFQPGWAWDSEDPEKWTFVMENNEQWLQIIGNPGRSNVLMREVPEGDFAIVAHIKAFPHMNFHQANIFIFQDLENYIVVNTGFCQPCPVGGHGYFMETVVSGGGALNHYELPRGENDLDVYLKIEVVGDVISGYYATQPGEWNRIGRFGNFYDLNSIGLSATNSSPPGGTPEDIIARFDYFEVIVP